MQPSFHPPDPFLSPRRVSTRSSDLRHSSRIKKPPLAPKSPNVRRIASMRPSKKSPSRKKSGLTRPIPGPVVPWMNPLAMHPPRAALKASISAPLQTLNSNLGASGQENSQNSQDQAPPLDVGAKVDAMLKSTIALKGEAKEKIITPASKRSRLFSKMTSVLSFSSSNNKKDEKCQPEDVETYDLAPMPIGGWRPDVPMDQLHACVNESNNLERDKVQQLAGHKIRRKPVPNGGQSITSLKSPPKVDERTLRKLESVDEAAPSEAASNESRPGSFSSFKNPFDSEPSLDENLENGVLEASPDGASTPRLQIRRRVAVDDNGSPMQKANVRSYHTGLQGLYTEAYVEAKESAIQSFRKNPPSQRCTYDVTTPRTSYFPSDRGSVSDKHDSLAEMLLDSPEEMAMSPEEMPQREKSQSPEEKHASSAEKSRHLVAPNAFGGEPRKKKHPTPGREWFENIEGTLTSYGRLSEDVPANSCDELAHDFGALYALTNRDSNGAMGNRRRQVVDADATTEAPSKVPSRIPRRPDAPRSDSEIDRQQTRAVRRLRPDDEDADEVDELF